jgi:hypothetical protein
MARIYPTLEPSALSRRASALAHYADWERQHGTSQAPGDALAGVAFLFELLPRESRARPLRTDGVARMHRLLAVLGQPPG